MTTLDTHQMFSAGAVAAGMAAAIYGVSGQIRTLAGSYNAPLALGVGTALSNAVSQYVIQNLPLPYNDASENLSVALSDLILYESAIVGTSNYLMYMQDRGAAAALIGASANTLGAFVSTSVFKRT